jgi:hypothetical protein
MQHAALLTNGLHFAHAPGPDQRTDVAVELRHPEPEIGRSRHDVGILETFVELRELIQACGREKAPVAVLKRDRLVMSDFGKRGGLLGEALGIARSRRPFAHLPRRLDDRTVAGAAAQIARQHVVGRGIAGFAEIHGVERHYEAGRAEAALRTVAVHQCLLDGVQRAARPGQMLDGGDAPAFQHRQQQDAGIDRVAAHRVALARPDHDRAGPAIALRAAFLGAGQAFGAAQILQERGRGIDVPQTLRFTVQDKGKMIAHRPGNLLALPRPSFWLTCVTRSNRNFFILL